eukprot:834288-Karenia_brevis.AAC.1
MFHHPLHHMGCPYREVAIMVNDGNLGAQAHTIKVMLGPRPVHQWSDTFGYFGEGHGGRGRLPQNSLLPIPQVQCVPSAPPISLWPHPPNTFGLRW